MSSRRCVVQGCSNVSDNIISAGISIHMSPIDKTSLAHIVHISNQMVALLFDLIILRQIPLKGQSMWMALLEG